MNDMDSTLVQIGQEGWERKGNEISTTNYFRDVCAEIFNYIYFSMGSKEFLILAIKSFVFKSKATYIKNLIENYPSISGRIGYYTKENIRKNYKRLCMEDETEEEIIE